MLSSIKQHPFKSLVYLICLLFILSGAVNYGLTRWYLAIPFMIGFLFIGKKFGILRISIFIIACSILFNFMLEKNPLIFPILSGGEVTLLRDGCVSDGIISFPPGGVEYGDCSKTKIGSIIKVTGIFVSYGDLVTHIGLKTELGGIWFADWMIFNKELATNKPLTNEITDGFSDLLTSFFWDIF